MTVPKGLTIGDEFLGKGAFGVVLKAKLYDEDVAVKILCNEDVAKCEINALLKVQGHRNICGLYSWFVIAAKRNMYGIVMPLYTTTTLIDLIEQRGPLDEDRFDFIFTSFIRALKHLHDRNIVHCDIKCENIMIDSEGEPILIDFGLVNCFGRAGSLQYCSPEKLTCGSECVPDPSSDIWSTGICMFASMCASLPFNAARACDPAFSAILSLQENGDFATCHNVYKLYKKSIPFTQDVCDIIDGMLTVCCTKRSKINNIMDSYWFKKCMISSVDSCMTELTVDTN
jgi:serine/threonine protein kinase